MFAPRLTASLCAQETGQASSNVRLSLVPESTPDFKSSDLELDEDDPNYAEYKRILERFNVTDVSPASSTQKKFTLPPQLTQPPGR